MKRFTTRILSLMLSVVLVCSCALPLTAFAADINDLPIVYIQGQGNTIYNEDGKKVFPGKSISTEISNHSSDIVDSSTKSFARNNWDYLEDTLHDIIDPVFEDILLDNNGEISNGTYHLKNTAAKKKTNGFTLTEYWFRYDWRLNPIAVADTLEDYIDSVLAATGKKKVQIVARCLGASVAAAYLTKYGNEKVDTAIFYAAACNGAIPISSFFSGHLSVDANSLSKYASSMGDDSDFAGAIKILANIMKISNLTASWVENNFEKVSKEMLPDLLLSCYATFPSYWSMISDKYYEEAKALVFGGREAEYSGLIEKIDDYHYNIQANLPATLRELTDNGMKFVNISKYNYELVPLYEESNLQSDRTVELEAMSFGATSADYGTTLSSDYIEQAVDMGFGNYISDDLIIDASTALFPDYTWYVKDCHHNTWPKDIDTLMMAIFHSKEQYTVNTNKNFPQFLQYNSAADTILPVTRYPYVYSEKLSSTTLSYTGKTQKPTVTVINNAGKTLKEGTDYTLTYSNDCKTIGKHFVNVTYKGDYSGKKTLYFEILPANVTASATQTSTSVTLSWNAVDGVDGYKVYKYNPSTKKYTTVKTTAETGCTIKKLSPATSYTFAVRAYKKVGSATYRSPSSSFVTITTTPETPTLKVTSSAKSAVLSWSQVTGATGYGVYMSTSKNGTYTKLGTTKGTSYTKTSLKAGKTYYFKIRAWSKVDGKTYYSSYSSVKSVKATNTPAATTLKASAAKSSVKLTWSKVPGATGYQVYMATSKNGTYKKVKTTSSVSYTKSSLASGQTYYFKVRAYYKTSSKTYYGSFSSVKYAKAK